jgi:hypothetical protein
LDEYDVFWNHSGATISNFLIAGYLYDLNNVEAFDFTKPWWDDTAIENLRLDDHLYMAFGDVNIYLFDFHSALLFNRDVSDKHNLNLYQMVQNGEWTIEKFIKLGVELAEPAATGAGYDRMAYTGYASATMYGFLHGADVKIISRDEDNVPVMGPIEEAVVDVLSAYNTLFKDTELCDTGDGYPETTFAAQKATFASCGVGALSVLRKEAFNYGILPFPKRDTAQKEYISFVTNQIQPMVIPKSASDPERTGIILENLAAESYRRVRPEYFEVLLYSKYVRDPESLENVQMIFNNETRFELEHVYDWGNFAGKLLDHLIDEANSYASSHTSQQKAINKSIANTLAQLAKHKN